MKIQSQQDTTTYLLEWLKSKKLTTNVWQECRATGVCLHSLLMGVQNATLETVFYKDSAIMCLGIYPSDLKTYVYTKTYH